MEEFYGRDNDGQTTADTHVNQITQHIDKYFSKCTILIIEKGVHEVLGGL